MSQTFFRTKSVEQSIQDTEDPEHSLQKKLGALDLIVFGVGVCIGAGIFVLTGQAAASNAGPAVSLSFLIAGIACGLAAMCYAEFASTVPVAGSAYTFTYATMGEFLAWVIGWDLILEFTVGSAALATSFSQYLAVVLDGTPLQIPEAVATAEGGFINLPAGLLVLAMTAILVVGVKVSSRVNQVVTAIKLIVVFAVIIAGIFLVKVSNWVPFVPPSQGASAEQGSALDLPLVQTLFGLEPSVFGWGGVAAAAAMVFFAFIGFDVVATTAEETKNPQRNMPIGIFGSLAIVTLLYMAVSLVITGMQSYKDIDPSDGAPLATAFVNVGLPVMGDLIAIGACIGLTVVCMILFMGQSRVGFAMARDGLLPTWLAKTHPRFKTPYRLTIIAGIIIAILASFIPLSELAHLVNIGTLAAFVLVSIGVVVLRRKRPDLPRSFKVPFVPVLPIIAAVVCFYLMLNLTAETWLRFVIWLVLGILIYVFYSRHHSRLNTKG
jgi:APA family basic amino acid/polyamine antiporter